MINLIISLIVLHSFNNINTQIPVINKIKKEYTYFENYINDKIVYCYSLIEKIEEERKISKEKAIARKAKEKKRSEEERERQRERYEKINKEKREATEARRVKKEEKEEKKEKKE